jgi:predicted permease
VSYGVWQRKFGGNPGIAGARVALNGRPFTVIGVAAEKFRGTETGYPVDVWAPIGDAGQLNTRLSSGILQDRAAGWIWMFGRLKPRVRIEAAQAEMKTIASQLARAYSVTNEARSVNLAQGLGMYPDDRAEITGLLGLLSGAVALLLLIACGNVAGLFMIRASLRTREMAVRLAIGAGPGRLIRQLLAEGLVLATIAGAMGLLIAQWATTAVVSLSESTSRLHRIDTSVDARVLVFTLLTCAITGLLFALAPASQSLKFDLASALKTGSAGAGERRSRVRSVLVIGQVALSFVLLSASSMLLRDLYRIVTANPGFETRNVAMMSIDLSTLPYKAEQGVAIQRQVLEKIARVPGVLSATLAGTVPPEDFSTRVSIFHPGEEPPPEIFHGREFDVGLRVDLNSIAPGYFQTLAIPLLEGRDFKDRDASAVIVSRKLAGRMWPGQNAIGKLIAWPDWNGPRRPPFEVVGVASDAKYRSLIGDAPLLMYIPAFEHYSGRMRVAVRTASNPSGMMGDVERAIHQVDKDVPVFGLETMSGHMSESLWQQKMAASWIGAFSFLALILATVGLYGVIAQSVAKRTRELGIRMALGAAPGAVSRLVVGEGMKLAVTGLAIGVPCAFALNRFMREMILGVSGKDPASLAAIAVLLSAVMLAACWIPARRAARVDPLIALHYE